MNSIFAEMGKKIRNLRKLKNLTQEELGEKAEMSYKFIGELERGKVNPSLGSLVQIATALGVNVKDLLPGEADLYSLSPDDLLTVKKAVKLLDKIFKKI